MIIVVQIKGLEMEKEKQGVDVVKRDLQSEWYQSNKGHWF